MSTDQTIVLVADPDFWKVSQQRYESILAVGKEQIPFGYMRLKKMEKQKCVSTIAKASLSLKL